MTSEKLQAILLPGGVLPAELAYPALVEALGPRGDARYKDLELYAADEPPHDYSLHTEVDGILRFADRCGFERFHLVGYSGGASSTLLACATAPDRILSLTVTEPAWAGNQGLSEAERALTAELKRVIELPEDEMMPAFVRMQLEPGVEPPAPQPGPTPPWMDKRPAGIRAFSRAFDEGELDMQKMAAFRRPVLFVLGGRSNQAYWRSMASRLSGVFPDFTVEVYEDRHHFDPPHRTEPERFARSLLSVWERAASTAGTT